MKGIAHISFEGGAFFMPAKTPYEREVLFDFLNQTTKRHGRARLALNHHGWTVNSQGYERQRCASCHRWPQGVTYSRGRRTLCLRCARRDIV
jgi:predicted RecB family nuclease